MKLTKDQYDALPDGLKAMYVADGDGFKPTFITQEQLNETVTGLKNNNTALLAENKGFKEKLSAAELTQQEALEKAQRAAGDFAPIEQGYKDKIAKLEADHQAALQAANGTISDLTVGAAQQAAAVEIFGSNAKLLGHHLNGRLSMEMVDGKPQVRVMKDGQPSAMTQADLVKEFRENKEFAPFIDSPPSGGTTPGGKPAPINTGAINTGNSMLERARQIVG
ncbi:hypothetical protein SUSUWATARI_00400 [Serratia phage vB_SmaM-Susuwatari]|nr:hypothetical protein SUSUWATARI_00400 [Serratia phage vB_SmaM-Susuwatari]